MRSCTECALAIGIAITLAGCSTEVGMGVVDGGSEADGGEKPEQDASPVSNDCPRARISVTPGNTLNVRGEPNTASAVVANLPNNAVMPVLASVEGEVVSGVSQWLEIQSGAVTGFVSGAFAMCTTDEAPVLQPPSAYHLPLECGTSARVSQANDGGTSHQGKAYYAFDFAIAINTPLVAMADGIVLYTFAETGPGDPCYDGGGSSCFPYANYVSLLHGDGTGSIYKHLNRVDVAVGEFVPSGATVGLSGSTGYSTGPHAHVMRQEECGAATSCQSIPVVFADVPGTGVPVKDQTVTSGNCLAP